jgi:hypothetical protein
MKTAAPPRAQPVPPDRQLSQLIKRIEKRRKRLARGNASEAQRFEFEDLVEQLRGMLQRLVPSAPWLDDVPERQDMFPIPGMVLSRQKTRFGEEGVPSRRFTPAIAVSCEDMFDRMDWLEAMRYGGPSSTATMLLRGQSSWSPAH